MPRFIMTFRFSTLCTPIRVEYNSLTPAVVMELLEISIEMREQSSFLKRMASYNADLSFKWLLEISNSLIFE